MSIMETITVETATVEVDDELRIELWQEKKRKRYTSEQARDLALELNLAADRADELIKEDMAERGMRLAHGRVVSEGGEVVL